jgi:hypothetical protein
MILYLNFILNENVDSINDIHSIPDIRRDLVLQANNDNKLKLHFMSDTFYSSDVDITGYEFFLTLKDNVSDTDGVTGATAVLEIDVTTLTEPLAGKTDITITRSQCENLEGDYLYSIKIKNTNDEILTQCYGIMSFIKELSTRI